MKKTVLFILLVLLLLVGVTGLYGEIKEYSEGEDEYDELEQFVSSNFLGEKTNVITTEAHKIKNVVLAPDEVVVDFDGLKKANNDCIEWILIPGTNVNYTVVEGIDNSYYVTHTFKKNVNKSGAIFVDMRNASDFSDRNTIIYGHNLKNSKMFSDLKKFINKSYFDNHKRIVIYTETEELVYEVFAVYTTMEDSDTYDVKFSTDEKFSEHIDMILNNSAVIYNDDKSDINKIITLSTCTNNAEGERVVVIAKQVEEIESSKELE